MEKITNIEIDLICYNRLNPRKNIDQKSLTDLSKSIAQRGILQPLLVRPLADGWELICGERRLRAARETSLDVVPCIVKEMSNSEAMEVMLIENLQREGVHPMEEAQSMQDLINSGLTREEISTRLGKPLSYIQRRLKLTSLIPSAQKGFIEGQFEYAQAIQLARLESDDQAKVLADATTGYGKEKRLLDSTGLANYIESHIMVRFKDAIWKLDDADLIPEAGACDACPKRTKNNPGLFDEADSLDRCTDPACFKLKAKKFLSNLQATTKEKHGEVAVGSMGYDKDVVKVKGHELQVLKKKEEGAIPVVITSDNTYGSQSSKKGKVVWAKKPEPVPVVKGAKGAKSKVDPKLVESLKEEQRKFRNRFRKKMFSQLFKNMTGANLSGPSLHDAHQYVFGLIINDDYRADLDLKPIAVELGIAVIPQGKELYSDSNYGMKMKDDVAAALDKNNIDLLELMLLSIATEDVEEGMYGNNELKPTDDLAVVCGFYGIDWKEELTRYTNEVNSKKAQDANKSIPDDNKVKPAAPAKKVAKKGKGISALLTDAN